MALDGVMDQSIKDGTDNDNVTSVYYYASAWKTEEVARRLGRAEEKMYEELAKEIREALLHEYFSGSGRLCIDTQTGYLLTRRFCVRYWRPRALWDWSIISCLMRISRNGCTV